MISKRSECSALRFPQGSLSEPKPGKVRFFTLVLVHLVDTRFGCDSPLGFVPHRPGHFVGAGEPMVGRWDSAAAGERGFGLPGGVGRLFPVGRELAGRKSESCPWANNLDGP